MVQGIDSFRPIPSPVAGDPERVPEFAILRGFGHRQLGKLETLLGIADRGLRLNHHQPGEGIQNERQILALFAGLLEHEPDLVLFSAFHQQFEEEAILRPQRGQVTSVARIATDSDDLMINRFSKELAGFFLLLAVGQQSRLAEPSAAQITLIIQECGKPNGETFKKGPRTRISFLRLCRQVGFLQKDAEVIRAAGQLFLISLLGGEFTYQLL